MVPYALPQFLSSSSIFTCGRVMHFGCILSNWFDFCGLHPTYGCRPSDSFPCPMFRAGLNLEAIPTLSSGELGPPFQDLHHKIFFVLTIPGLYFLAESLNSFSYGCSQNPPCTKFHMTTFNSDLNKHSEPVQPPAFPLSGGSTINSSLPRASLRVMVPQQTSHGFFNLSYGKHFFGGKSF